MTCLVTEAIMTPAEVGRCVHFKLRGVFSLAGNRAPVPGQWHLLGSVAWHNNGLQDHQLGVQLLLHVQRIAPWATSASHRAIASAVGH
jgi:hypothetical protein